MNYKNKKAQITIFVIIGILLVSAIGIFLVTQNKIIENTNTPSQKEISPSSGIRDIAQTCMETALLDGTRILGFQGGYVRLPDKYLTTKFTDVAYTYYAGEKTFPSKEKMQEEIAYYLDNAVPICFEDNNKYNYEVVSRNASSKVEIAGDYVTAEIIYPISVKRNGTISDIKQDYEVKIPIKLERLQAFGQQLIDKTSNEPNFVPMTYLLNSPYNTSFIYSNGGDVIYTIIDGNSTINQLPYVFFIATKTR